MRLGGFAKIIIKRSNMASSVVGRERRRKKPNLGRARGSLCTRGKTLNCQKRVGVAPQAAVESVKTGMQQENLRSSTREKSTKG